MMRPFGKAFAATLGLTLAILSGAPSHAEAPTHYRTAKIDGQDIAYREAGPADGPAILLLHGFPTSSRMFRNLIPRLSDRYHVIAPDYPGFGASALPDRASFEVSFAHYAQLIDRLVTQLGVTRYALYVQDYGAPIGFRLALAHPERISALVIQNGNAYDAGLSAFWAPIQAYWSAPTPDHRQALRAGLTPAATKSQYVDGVDFPDTIDPENWLVDQTLLDRPGADEVMLDLFLSYRTNVELYPRFQEFFRARRPPTLVVWGKKDIIFPAEGAKAYLADLPDAEIHLLESGHFALEDKTEEIASLMRRFLARVEIR